MHEESRDQQVGGSHGGGPSYTRRSDLHRRSRAGVLILSALGVVFGDIGTSPLYALRECFDGVHAIPVNVVNVYGVFSLIVWSLIITVSVKYVLFVMRADNEGEGGILALVALVRGRTAGHVPPDADRASACSAPRCSTATA